MKDVANATMQWTIECKTKNHSCYALSARRKEMRGRLVTKYVTADATRCPSASFQVRFTVRCLTIGIRQTFLRPRKDTADLSFIARLMTSVGSLSQRETDLPPIRIIVISDSNMTP